MATTIFERWETFKNGYYKCFVCGLLGSPCLKGRPFNPHVPGIHLCPLHWSMWRECMFRIPMAKRRQVLVDIATKLRKLKAEQLQAGFLIAWDSLPLR